MLKQEPQSSKARQFICPCGKSYFSYAALFTHVKQKHDGKAPGQIIKPKAENKRGRPRKIQLSHSSCSSIQGQRKAVAGGDKDMGRQNRFNSMSDLNQKLFDLKFTPGSKFTQYKKDSEQPLTSNSLSSEDCFQGELLKDLSRYLQIKQVNAVPDEMLMQIKASYLLYSGVRTESCTISFIKRFLEVCRQGLRKQTYTQLFLLLSMLLQHILEQQCLQDPEQLQASSIHEHIVSFFEYINRVSRKLDLSPFNIFSDLNTIKSLIVFFNWLSKIQTADPLTQDSASLE